MAMLPGPLLLLGAAGLALLPGGCGSLSHSLRYFSLGVTEPSQKLPQFLSTVYLDEQPIARYDSLTRRTVPLVPWMEEMQKRDPNYWIKEMETLQATERAFRIDLENVRRCHHQNGGPPSHSLCYSYLQVSEPSQRLPQFLSMVHLDDQPIARYDSLTRQMEPLVPWMEEVEKGDPSYWNREMETLRATETVFRADLEDVQKVSPQLGGLHTWQAILGCELREDGSKRGYWDYGYDGRDFISFNKETRTWVAGEAQAQVLKREWDANQQECHKKKVYLEETCTERLQRYLAYRKEALQRTEPPAGKVTGKKVSDSLETLICQAYGFYPKEISATWRRDGQVCKYETFRRNVAPNSDGTYYVWLSIEMDPKERDLFRCQLEHDGLQEPLVLTLKEGPARERLILVGTILVLLGLLMILLLLTWYRRRLKSSVGNRSVDPFVFEVEKLQD